MNALETNIYRIENLDELSAKYRLYRLKGLSPEQDDYHRNLNILVTGLSRTLLSPVASLQRNGATLVAIQDGDAEPKSPQLLVRRTVHLEKLPDILELNFSKLNDETRPLALKFLQFAAQGALRRQSGLWQPNGGGAFFDKSPESVQRGIGLHCGYLVRSTSLPDGGIGLCVDARHKYVSESPLSSQLSRQDFNRVKMSHAIYRFGHAWFEVRLAEWSELTAQEHVFPDGGREVNLLEYIQEKTHRPLPPELVRLPKDCSVVHYYNSSKDLRAAPSALCYPVFDTSDGRVRRAHGRTVMAPHIRRGGVHDFVDRRLRSISHNGKSIRLAAGPTNTARRHFTVPDLKFGGNTVLSVKKTPGAQQTDLRDLGRARLALLTNRTAGFVVTSPMQNQFLFVPETIHRSWGPQLIKDLSTKVDALFPQESGYSPQIIVYDDRKGRTFVEQGTAVLNAAKASNAKDGFAVVMVHEPSDRKPRKSDQLAAYAVRSLRRDCNITAAVIHTATGMECYEQPAHANPPLPYRSRADKRGKLDGYLRNVALNKVLLTNEKWPFILAEKTYADLTIGVDVKSHYAGFIAVGQGGAYIAATQGMECRQPEQIGEAEFRKLMIATVQDYVNATGDLARAVVIHRDGRMFESELKGAKAAFEWLRDQGLLAPDAALNCVEIGKSSFTSLRLFDVIQNGNGRGYIQNPEVGDYFIASEEEGYICATGRAFPRDGTVSPLHIRRIFGSLSLEQLMRDIYWLTVLAWTRPEDCTRYPITIKLNDRRLFEDAGEFDEHEIILHEEEATI
jgi:hypothetical protein